MLANRQNMGDMVKNKGQPLLQRRLESNGRERQENRMSVWPVKTLEGVGKHYGP